MEPIGKYINKHHLSIDSSGITLVKHIPINSVDRIADSLVREYDNPQWRKWYCGVIYEFGLSKIEEWRIKAKEGKSPSKLFSLYVSEARKYHGQNR